MIHACRTHLACRPSVVPAAPAPAHLLQCCVFGSPGSTSATVGDPTEVRSEPGASGRSSPLDWTPSSPSVSLRRLSGRGRPGVGDSFSWSEQLS